MADHLTIRQIQGYQQRSLTPSERVAVSEHLATCETCRSLVRQARGAHTSAQVLAAELQAVESEPVEHLSYEEMATYVDGRASEVEREIVEGHIETCAACTLQVRELRAFRARLSTYPDTVYAPEVPTTLLHRLLARLRASPRRFLLQMAGAAALGVLVASVVGLGSSRVLIRQWQSQQAQLVQAKQQRDQAQKALAVAEKERQEMLRREQEAALAAERHQQALQAQMHRQIVEAQRTVQAAHAAQVAAEQSQRQAQRAQVALQQRMLGREQEALAAAEALGSALPPLQVARLIPEQSGVRGADVFVVVAPVGTAVREARPTFAWRHVDGAVGYQVSVFDPTRPNGEIAGGKTTSTTWRPDRALPAGKALQWRVSALMPDGQKRWAPGAGQPDAKFIILEPSEVEALRAWERQVGPSAVKRGLLYWRTGLLEEAAAQFESVSKTDPAYPKAQELLKNLRHQRHLEE